MLAASLSGVLVRRRRAPYSYRRLAEMVIGAVLGGVGAYTIAKWAIYNIWIMLIGGPCA